MSAPRYRGALVGAGGVALLAHLPGYRVGHSPRLSIAAVLDEAERIGDVGALPHVRRREELARAAGGALDFVDICTPTSSHLDLVTWALSQGWHVLCEKPVALGVAEAETIARAARKADRVVMPCHQYRHNPAWLQVKAWLDSGVIGRWHLAEVRVSRLAADQGAQAGGTPWRGRKEHSLGGVLLDHGTHWMYLLLDVAGAAPTAVHGWTGRLRHTDYDVEDTAHLLLEFPGRLATMLVTWAGTRRENSIRFIGPRGAIEWSGTRLELDAEGRKESLDMAKALDKAVYKEWFAALLARFAAAMDEGHDEASLDEILQVAHILEVAYRAPLVAAAP